MFLKSIGKDPIIRNLELLTVFRFFETVVWIVVGGVYIYLMSKFLQPESSIDHKPFSTA